MVMLWIIMWTESWGRLPTYLLVGGLSLNVVHACSLFFFWKQKMSTRHAYQWSWQNEDFNRDLEFWTCFLEVRWIWSFGCVSQRSDGFEIWTCFPEVRWFEVWTCFPKVRWIWIWTCFPEVRWFDFGRASQRSIEIEFGGAS